MEVSVFIPLLEFPDCFQLGSSFLFFIKKESPGFVRVSVLYMEYVRSLCLFFRSIVYLYFSFLYNFSLYLLFSYRTIMYILKNFLPDVVRFLLFLFHAFVQSP